MKYANIKVLSSEKLEIGHPFGSDVRLRLIGVVIESFVVIDQR